MGGVCTDPGSAPTGYTFASTLGGDLKIASFSRTGVTCDTGYSGTVTETACTTGGQDYTVAGCEADCTQPTSETGYNFGTADTGSLAKNGFARDGVTCATNYVGTVTETACTTGGQDYTVSGCEGVCTDPGSAPTGYTFASTLGGDLKIASFSRTGITCDTGYSGTVVATVCDSAGGAWTLSGCELDCTQPTSVTGYNFGTADTGSLA